MLLLLLEVLLIPILITIGGYLLGHNKVLASGAFLFAFALTIIAIDTYLRQETAKQEAAKETETHWLLTPANDPPPFQPKCVRPPSSDDFFVFFGTAAVRPYPPGTDTPYSVITIGDQNLLSLSRDDTGAVQVIGKIFDEDGILADIKGAKFTVFRPGFTRREQPDAHTLIVYDKWDKERLHVRFLNPHAINITGTFFYPDHLPVIANGDTLRMEGITQSDGVCLSSQGNSMRAR